MRHLASSFIVALGLSLALAGAPAAKTSTVTCTDGTTSKAGRGACSHHGGVASADTATKPPAAAPSETAGTPTKKSAGGATEKTAGAATAKCKDGTMSHSAHHQGACSHHGGVAQWLD